MYVIIIIIRISISTILLGILVYLHWTVALVSATSSAWPQNIGVIVNVNMIV